MFLYGAVGSGRRRVSSDRRAGGAAAPHRRRRAPSRLRPVPPRREGRSRPHRCPPAHRRLQRGLATDDVEVARAVAAVVRGAGGGFPASARSGSSFLAAAASQVGMNVEDWRTAPLHEVVARRARDARPRGRGRGWRARGFAACGRGAGGRGPCTAAGRARSGARARAAAVGRVGRTVDSRRDGDAGTADGRRPEARGRVGGRGARPERRVDGDGAGYRGLAQCSRHTATSTPTA